MVVTRTLVAGLALLTATIVTARAQTDPAPAGTRVPAGLFHVKPPEMSIPPDAMPGTMRRIIQPFGPWTLICDENLTTRRRVCNVSQVLVDQRGSTVFSWSLAASQAGPPVFIVRLPSALAQDHFVQVAFGEGDPIEASALLSACDAETCIGFLAVDARIRKQIRAGGRASVRVRIGPAITTFEVPLEGLDKAVASLKSSG